MAYELKSNLLRSNSYDKNQGDDLADYWCKLCRDDIANSADAKNLLVNNNIAYLYFSTDKDKKAWRTASSQDKISDHQHIFGNNVLKQFKAFIELGAIPRYFFLDQNHYVKTLFGPRPTAFDENAFKKTVAQVAANYACIADISTTAASCFEHKLKVQTNFLNLRPLRYRYFCSGRDSSADSPVLLMI